MTPLEYKGLRPGRCPRRMRGGNAVITRKQANRKESQTVKVVRTELRRRIKAVALERDALRRLITDCEALAESCEDAVESLQGAAEALSKYA